MPGRDGGRGNEANGGALVRRADGVDSRARILIDDVLRPGCFDENVRGRGYGSRILKGLEAEAARRGAKKVVLNARDSATEFYARHGYASR